MNNIETLMQSIESDEFAAYIGLASGFSVVRLALKESDIVSNLIAFLRSTPEKSKLVFERIQAMVSNNPELEYLHPQDEAMTAYLYVLGCADISLAREALEIVLTAPNLWWAKRMAEHIKADLSVTTPNTQTYSIVQPGAISYHVNANGTLTAPLLRKVSA